MSGLTFNGTPEQQHLATEVFRLMTAQGALFAVDAPIRQTLSNLADFLAAQQQRDVATVAQEIDAALLENAQVFARQETNGEVIYITSRRGAFQERPRDISHSFRERLYEPEEPLPVDDISVVVSTSRPALTTVEPVFISDYWQQQAGLVPTADADVYPGIERAGSPRPEVVPPLDEVPLMVPPARMVPEEFEPVAEVASLPAEVLPVPPLVAAGEAPPPFDQFDAAEAEVLQIPEGEVPALAEVGPADLVGVTPEEEVAVDAELVAASSIEAVEPTVPTEEIAAVEAVMVETNAAVTALTTITLPDDTRVDLSQPISRLIALHGPALEAALIQSIDKDPLQQVVRFARDLLSTANLVNLGKNDLRRIREYIVEVGEPVLDTAIIGDLYYHSPRQSSYESFRFSLNYRLSREKDFEFVGVKGAYLWSTRGLPAIGTKRVKASEMGQLTSYLVEGYDNSLDQAEAAAIAATGALTRNLTFFEWEYGILPLDARLSAFLPKPLLDNQRSVVLRFESPQHYTSYPVEVRYPTGNRGGWAQGLEEFFHEHMVAGTLITLTRTEDANVFTITYTEIDTRADRILTLDEKKNKFAFANVSYTSTVDPDHFLSQQKFGKLKNLKALPMTERRKADLVLSHVFEATGEQVGSRSEPLYWMSLDDLYVAYNVLRPISRSYLEALLAEDEAYSADEATHGAYYYKPEPEPEDDQEDGEEDILMSDMYDDEDRY